MYIKSFVQSVGAGIYFLIIRLFPRKKTYHRYSAFGFRVNEGEGLLLETKLRRHETQLVLCIWNSEVYTCKMLHTDL